MVKVKNQKSVQEYMELPWEIRIRKASQSEGGGFCAYIVELGEKACTGYGDTMEEAIETMRIVQEDIIQDLIDEGEPIPEPEKKVEYSGRFIVRGTPDLHKRISEKAKASGVSLNHMANSLLEKGYAIQCAEEVLEEVRLTVDKACSEIRESHRELWSGVRRRLGSPSNTFGEEKKQEIRRKMEAA